MMIDTHYHLDYSKYEPWLCYDSTLDNKSLIAKGVRHIGYLNAAQRINLYHVYIFQLLTPKEYQKLARLLIDIHNESDSDKIHVVFIVTKLLMKIMKENLVMKDTLNLNIHMKMG